MFPQGWYLGGFCQMLDRPLLCIQEFYFFCSARAIEFWKIKSYKLNSSQIDDVTLFINNFPVDKILIDIQHTFTTKKGLGWI